jgi:hypothetical protein
MTTNQPADHLLEVLLGILTPILMTGGVTDPGLARLAAQEAIAAGRTDAQASLMTIAQTVGFARGFAVDEAETPGQRQCAEPLRAPRLDGGKLSNHG